MSTEDEVRDLMSRASALPYGRGRSQLWAEAAAWGDCGDRGDAAGEATLGAGARYPAPAARPAP